MAHRICTALDRAEGKKARKCDSGCENYRFDHLDNACVLSEVYSVNKGVDCYIYKVKLETEKGK